MFIFHSCPVIFRQTEFYLYRFVKCILVCVSRMYCSVIINQMSPVTLKRGLPACVICRDSGEPSMIVQSQQCLIFAQTIMDPWGNFKELVPLSCCIYPCMTGCKCIYLNPFSCDLAQILTLSGAISFFTYTCIESVFNISSFMFLRNENVSKETGKNPYTPILAVTCQMNLAVTHLLCESLKNQGSPYDIQLIKLETVYFVLFLCERNWIFTFWSV